MDTITNLTAAPINSQPAYLRQIPGHQGGVPVSPAPDPLATMPGLSTDPFAQAIDIRDVPAIYTAGAQLAPNSQQMFGSLINLLDTEPTGA
jgi:hypothetical protein